MKRSYRLSLPAWAVTQREDYYERMAARGLFVRRCGSIVTSYEPREPQRCLYRLDAAEERNTEPPEEQRRLYESCGWTFVCKSDWFNLYTAQPGTEELHTDGEWQSETLRPMRRSLRNDLIAKVLYAVFCVVLFLVSSLPFSRGMTLWESVQLTTAALGWLAPITLGYILLQVGSLALSFAAFSGYVRRLRAVRPRAAVSGRAFVACHMGLNALGVVLLLGVFVLWLAAIPRTVPLEQASGKEHIVRLEQLDPDAELFVGTGNGGIESGTVDCCDVPLTSFTLDSRQLSEPDGASPSLFQHYIEVLFPVDMQAAARGMAKKSFLYEAVPVDAAQLPEGIDFAFMNTEYEGVVELCAVSGNRMLALTYIGGRADAESVLQCEAQALLA